MSTTNFDILKDIITRRLKNLNSETGNFSGNVNVDGKFSVLGGMTIDEGVVTDVNSISFPTGGASGIDLGTSTVTQITSSTTAVTLNAQSGKITTFASTLAGVTSLVFTVNNTNILTTSSVIASLQNYSGTWVTNGIPLVAVENILAGSFDVRITNVHATNALAGTMIIGFLNVY